MEEAEYLKAKEAAGYMRISLPTFYACIQLEGLRHIKFGRTLRTKKQWIDEWMESKSQALKF